MYSEKLIRDTLRKAEEIRKAAVEGVADQKTVDDLKEISLRICEEFKALRK